MSVAVETALAAVAEGQRITIYGDFDCDGVCATSILVGAFRGLGGECDWFIPDRISEGYGLNPEAIREIASRGTSLVVTVDCGVTAVDEVALARNLGMEIVVTDHHQPDDDLPDCPILHPVVSRYPFTELCGAAVAAKFASALRRTAAERGTFNGPVVDQDEADLDLVALATVADVMPLIGENRHLVREGVKVARRARRIGMAALMADAKVEPSRLSSEDFGFRLGPRINAAGRMYRADAGVELFMADSKERAAEIATELASINAERRRVEREVEAEAKVVLREQEESGPAVVVAGEGWHPGVVGIVASKLVKATGRPSVVIALDGESGRGSARSVPGLDLHSAIAAASSELEGFGGHAAAAGLTIRADRVDRFREALGEAVKERIGTEPAEQFIEFDAIAGGSDLGMDMAEELEKLQPFGKGNPAVRLLIPGARIENLEEMGEGRHCRFAVVSGAGRARGVCFGRTSFGLLEGERADVVAELGVNHWNGSVEPQLRVTDVLPVGEAEPLVDCEAGEWWDRFEVSMEAGLEKPEGGGSEAVAVTDMPGRLPGVSVSELISSGERVAVLTADARQRWTALGGASLARFIPGLPDSDPSSAPVSGLWSGSPGSELGAAATSRVLLTEYQAITREAAPSLESFDRIALLDPPFTAAAVAAVATAGRPVHLLAGPDEFAFTARVASHRLDLTSQLRNLFRGLRDGGAIDGQTLAGDALRAVLVADGETTRAPEEAALLLTVLLETGLARTEGVGSARSAGVVSSEKTDLSVSAVFVHFSSLHKDHERFLNHFNRQTPKQ